MYISGVCVEISTAFCSPAHNDDSLKTASQYMQQTLTEAYLSDEHQ